MCIPYEGFTWQVFKTIGTDVLCDLSEAVGYTALNFMVDSEDWSVIAYLGNDHEGLPLWRIVYLEPPELPGSQEAIMVRAH